MSRKKTERQLNLIAVLLEARVPVTLEEIRDNVCGYKQDDTNSFKRMFERDKRELRDMGIPIEVEPTDLFGEEQGYRIPKDAYYLPEIDFDPDERLALWLLHKLVRQGTFPFSRDVQKALLKLSPDLGTEETGGKPALDWLVSEERQAEENLSLLLRAVIDQKKVRFSYLSLHDEEPREREVDPYGLFFEHGSWYLVGHCHLRSDIRCFRVSRMHGEVEFTGSASREADFKRPRDFRVRDYSARPPWEFEDGPEFKVVIRFSPKLAWWVEENVASYGYDFHRDKNSGGTLTLKARSRDTLLAWALSFGEDAEIISPAHLRKAMRERLLEIKTALSGRKG
jgi:predicted DNA-binding transcriptional regulator YafY